MVKDFKREIKLEDPRLIRLVKRKQDLVLQGRKLSEEAEELAKKHAKLVEKIQKIAEKVQKLQREKIIPRAKEVAEHLLNEWELPLTTELKDDGTLVLIVEDALEEFKHRFRQSDKFLEPIKTKKQTKKDKK